MKKYLSVIVMFALFLLIIPSIAIFTDEDSQANISKKKIEIEKITEVSILDIDTLAIEKISIKDYLIGSVLAQMPANFEKDAIMSQAILCNTYALRRHQEEKQNPTKNLQGADISTDATLYLAYFNPEQAKSFYGDKYEESYIKVEECVSEVIGKILVYDNEPIIVAFHSISSGRTESAKNVWGVDIPYLVPVDVESDTILETFKEEITFTKEELKSRLSANFNDLNLGDDMKKWIVIDETTESGYVKSVNIAGDSQKMSGTELSTILNLKSSSFEIEIKDDSAVFKTKGYGHGVGMSQYGANEMAKENTYDKILKYFFNGSRIVTVK